MKQPIYWVCCRGFFEFLWNNFSQSSRFEQIEFSFGFPGLEFSLRKESMVAKFPDVAQFGILPVGVRALLEENTPSRLPPPLRGSLTSEKSTFASSLFHPCSHKFILLPHLSSWRSPIPSPLFTYSVRRLSPHQPLFGSASPGYMTTKIFY